MKLTDLNPRGVLDADIVIGGRNVHDTDRDGMGISFECPCCRGTARTTRLAVFFANPIDGKPPSDDHKLWARAGDSYDSMTLSPSIDASASGHWHGFIENGSVR